MRLTREEERLIAEAIHPTDYLADIKPIEEIKEEKVTCGIAEGQYFVRKESDGAVKTRMSKKFTEFAGFIGEATNNYETAIQTAANVNDAFSEKCGLTVDTIKDELIRLAEGNLRKIQFSLYDDALYVEYAAITQQDAIYLKEDMESFLTDSEWKLGTADLQSMTIKRDVLENEKSWNADVSIEL
jgi:hypothetical protein